MGILHDAHNMPMPGGDSAPQNTAVGGGSRPTKSKMMIPTSGPENARTMGRAPAGWLGDTQKSEAPKS